LWETWQHGTPFRITVFFVKIATPVKMPLSDILSSQHSTSNRLLELTDTNFRTACTWLTIREPPYTRSNLILSCVFVCLSDMCKCDFDILRNYPKKTFVMYVTDILILLKYPAILCIRSLFQLTSFRVRAYISTTLCFVIIIINISNLSNDRSKASSKTIPPYSAI